jgi:hypothetical protein
MPKKAALLFTLLTLIACFLSYSLGAAPTALARTNAGPQEAGVLAPLPAPPAEWVVNASGNISAAATKPGVAGVQHVADCIQVTSIVGGTSPQPYGNLIELLDGTTVIMSWLQTSLPNTQAASQTSLCGLSVVGSVGNAMTLKYQGGENTTQSVTVEYVNLVGHDAT